MSLFGKKKHDSSEVVDPICGMKIDPATAAAQREHEGTTYYFCSDHCPRRSTQTPTSTLTGT